MISRTEFGFEPQDRDLMIESADHRLAKNQPVSEPAHGFSGNPVHSHSSEII
jgi:hypothetical protein